MVEPENAVTITPLRPEDDYSPRERRGGGLRLALLQPETHSPLRQRHAACLVRSEKGLGFSIAGGKGSTPYRAGDGVRQCAWGTWRGLPEEQAVLPFWPAGLTVLLLPPLQGIFISRIAEGGAAHRAGTLQVGDRVLSVSEGRWARPVSSVYPAHPL
jgi:protein scribble